VRHRTHEQPYERPLEILSRYRHGNVSREEQAKQCAVQHRIVVGDDQDPAKPQLGRVALDSDAVQQPE
jgi:hypothetical protein